MIQLISYLLNNKPVSNKIINNLLAILVVSKLIEKSFYILLLCLDSLYDRSEEWPPIQTIIKQHVCKMYKNRGQILMDRLPILKWLPKYRLNYFFYDFIAGVTVGLTAIPQGIAYAVVAGLPPEYGLYAGFSGVLPYLILGSCKDVIIGKP